MILTLIPCRALAAWPKIIFPSDEGITLVKGSTYTIKWDSVRMDPVPILLIREVEPDYYEDVLIIKSAQANSSWSGSVNWTVPSNVPNGSNYYIQVGIEGVMVAFSDYPFTISATAPTKTPTPSPSPSPQPSPTAIPVGSLQVTLYPEEAASAGGRWRIAGRSWRSSGYRETALPVGSYTVEFDDVEGWTTPDSIVADVYAWQVAYRSGAYTLPVRRGLFVGIDHYQQSTGLPDLTSRVNDASAMRALLLQDGGNRWKSSNLVRLADEQATKTSIRGGLARMAGLSQKGDLALYYHTGHGGSNGGTSAALFCHDAPYQDTELGVDLAAFDSDVNVVVIVDACNSEGLYLRGSEDWDFAKRVMEAYRAARGAGEQRPTASVSKTLGSNIAFMVASSYDEPAWGTDQGGFYSRALMKSCLTGSSDLNLDGESQFFEMHLFAEAEVLSLMPGQHARWTNQSLLQNLEARTAASSGLAEFDLCLRMLGAPVAGVVAGDRSGDAIVDAADLVPLR